MVVKSQILAGGRGLGKFTNGLQVRRQLSQTTKGLLSVLYCSRSTRMGVTTRPGAAAEAQHWIWVGRQGSRCVSSCSRLAGPAEMQAGACQRCWMASWAGWLDNHMRASTLASSVLYARFLPAKQGGVHICKATEAEALASKMLGSTLVTKQVPVFRAGAACWHRGRYWAAIVQPVWLACWVVGCGALRAGLNSMLPPTLCTFCPAPCCAAERRQGQAGQHAVHRQQDECAQYRAAAVQSGIGFVVDWQAHERCALEFTHTEHSCWTAAHPHVCMLTKPTLLYLSCCLCS